MKYRLNTVHHNPGEPHFKSAFNDPATVRACGFNGQVYKHLHACVTFDAFGDVFPAGSKRRAWLETFTRDREQEIRAAKAEGLMVLHQLDLFLFPRTLVDAMRNELCDQETGRITLDAPKTLSVSAMMFDELVRRFPDVDGFIIRVGETDTYDMPHHVANTAVRYGNPTAIPAEQAGFIKLLGFLRDTVCVRHDRLLIFRTWDTRSDRFHTDPAYYETVTDAVAPHPKLLFSIKHTARDYWRWVRLNLTRSRGRHPQIVEVQCQREYEGKGAYPNYIADGVINGFEELGRRGGLADTDHRPYDGISVWSRGGGWFGPYVQNEFWCALNTWVLARWAQAPDRTEPEVFADICRERLGLDAMDTAAFRGICLDSAAAVLKGRYCTAWDSRLAGLEIPTNLWMRDDRMGGMDHLSPIFRFLRRNNLLDTALAEKREAVAIWDRIVRALQALPLPDRALHEALVTSAVYGQRLFRVVEAAWQALSLAEEIENTGRRDAAPALAERIATFDRAWESYQQTATLPGAASLHEGVYWDFPGKPSPPGLLAAMDGYRDRDLDDRISP